jgi:hypothetical protein
VIERRLIRKRRKRRGGGEERGAAEAGWAGIICAVFGEEIFGFGERSDNV